MPIVRAIRGKAGTRNLAVHRRVARIARCPGAEFHAPTHGDFSGAHQLARLRRAMQVGERQAYRPLPTGCRRVHSGHRRQRRKGRTEWDSRPSRRCEVTCPSSATWAMRPRHGESALPETCCASARAGCRCSTHRLTASTPRRAVLAGITPGLPQMQNALMAALMFPVCRDGRNCGGTPWNGRGRVLGSFLGAVCGRLRECLPDDAPYPWRRADGQAICPSAPPVGLAPGGGSDLPPLRDQLSFMESCAQRYSSGREILSGSMASW